ncbi:MAG TPA: hypothetical protein PLP83_08400 [Candidatus Aminicenantes bacterium]|nr:hypothetical protein [Candidatus Aminicenantes bacterium]
MKRYVACAVVSFLVIGSLTAAGQSAGALAKSGDKAVAKGDFYNAALSYLGSLGKKPKSVKTKDKLAEIAKQAYEQKLGLAEQYRANGNLEGAIAQFRELEAFTSRLRAYVPLNFVTIDFRSTMADVSESAAELRYQSAEGYFDSRNYSKAIVEYKAALNLKTPYKDCLDKIAESNYCMGAESESGSSFRRAADLYLESCTARPNYKDARQKAAAIYYALGSYFLDAGYYRKAYEDLSKAQAIEAEFSDVRKKAAVAKEMATVRVAFVRFDNITGVNIAGMALADVIMDGVKSRVSANGSQFIRTIDRDELSTVAREQRISEGQLNESLSSPLKLEGVDYLVFGKLNQVRHSRPGRTFENASATYEFSFEVPYTDSKGRQKTRTEYRQAPMYFDIVRDGYTLHIGGSVKVIAVKTGRVVLEEPIVQEAGDKVVFATNVRMRHPIDSVILDNDVVTLLQARQTLADEVSVTNTMIADISNSVASKVLSAIDRPTGTTDPGTLKY